LKQQVSTTTAVIIIIAVLAIAALVVWKLINRASGPPPIRLNVVHCPICVPTDGARG
jgi:hypothetical protein